MLSEKAVNPLYFSHRAFNLGANNQTWFYDIKITEKYLDSLPKLNLVLIWLTYTSLDYDLSLSKESWRCQFYNFSYGIDNPQATKYTVAGFLESKFKIAYYKPKEILDYFIKPTIPDYDSLGYPSNYNLMENKALSPSGQVDKKIKHNTIANQYWYARNTALMDNFLKIIDESLNSQGIIAL